MRLVSRRFGIECEIALKAERMKLRTGNIPITYGQRIGQAKLSPYKDGLEILNTFVRFIFWTP
jgi:hypothetical protein